MVAEGETRDRNYSTKVPSLNQTITANPAAQLSYSKPMVQTYSPSSGWNQPAGNYTAPYANPAPVGSQAVYAPAAKAWVNPQPAPAQAVAAPPAPPPAPPQGGRQWYNSLDTGRQVQTQNDFLGGDADYNAQMGEYDRALNDFIARITQQKQGFDTDANNAIDATNRNEEYSGNALGEDFGARGMSYSGLFDKSKNDMGQRFKEQRSNIDNVRAKNKTEADNRQADYQAENNIGRSNAKRSALTRMAAQQALLDSNAGF